MLFSYLNKTGEFLICFLSLAALHPFSSPSSEAFFLLLNCSWPAGTSHSPLSLAACPQTILQKNLWNLSPVSRKLPEALFHLSRSLLSKQPNKSPLPSSLMPQLENSLSQVSPLLFLSLSMQLHPPVTPSFLSVFFKSSLCSLSQNPRTPQISSAFSPL